MGTNRLARRIKTPLISPENPLWRNIIGVLAAIVIIPLGIAIKLISLPFERPMKRVPGEVVQYLQDFIDGTGEDWDWDDFICCPISDPQLEALRVKACDIELPINDDGIAELRILLAEAKQIDAKKEKF